MPAMLITDYGVSGLLPPLVLLAALLIDAIFGEFGPLFRVLPHPVAMIGAVTGWLDRRLNRDHRAAGARAFRGAIVAIGFALAMGALGWALADISRKIPFGWAIELLAVVLLLAQRSLFDHVRAVARALDADGLAGGRVAVAKIVGRDPEQLDEHGVARAAIESLAESFSDAVVAPAFWYLLFGLPGLFVYKTINTMDSMIGHRTERHAAFGAAAARLDDALNYAPARLAGVFIVAAAMFTPKGLSSQALKVMLRDGKKHRSPNAGRPEAAMAGALSVALSGPRRYEGKTVNEPWLGEEFSARIGVVEIRRALYLFVVACLVNAAVIAGIITYLIA
ncbi:MAG: adenosylcobinamide-phosphate synthase [Alphaproteobacteria bacterium]|jgi:adenosylcobinamide-phosphate synthase